MLCKNSLTNAERISHILAFVFLCLIQPPVSLRIRCQQPLHSRELITEVTGLDNGVKVSRLSNSHLLMTRFFSGLLAIYSILNFFFRAVTEVVLLKEL